MTGWVGDENDKGHRLHDAVLMMDVTTGDLMYHHLYNFLVDSDIPGLRPWPENSMKWLRALRLIKQPQHSSIHNLNRDDMISIVHCRGGHCVEEDSDTAF